MILKINWQSRWYRALILGGTALALRLLYIALGGGGVAVEQGKDFFRYDAFARLMISGWGWITTPWASREPLYPAFVALAYKLPGSEIGTLQLLQALLGAAAVSAAYLALRSLVKESIAVLASMFIAFNLHFIVWSAEPLRENLIIPLLVGFLMVFLIGMANRRILYMFFSAFLYALLVHTDVRFLVMVVVIPVMAFAYHKNPKAAVKQSLWMWLFFFILMIPYQVRGYVAMGKTVIVTQRFLGKWLDRAAKVSLWTGDGGTGNKRTAWLNQWEAEKRSKLEQLSPAERQYFLAGGRPDIGTFGVHWTLFKEYWRFARLKPMYRPYPDGRFTRAWSLRHNASSSLVIVPFLVFLPFILLGSSKASRQVAYPLLIFLLAHSMMHVLVHARERYRIPMEVITCILLAMALVNLWSLLMRKKSAPAFGTETINATDRI
jgi:hypothetical protein